MDSHRIGSKFLFCFVSFFISKIESSEAVLFVLEFSRGIRRHKSFAKAWFIFCCEKNMAHEAGFLTEEFISDHTKNIGLREKEGKDYGSETTNESKVRSAYKVRMLSSYLFIYELGKVIDLYGQCTNHE